MRRHRHNRQDAASTEDARCLRDELLRGIKVMNSVNAQHAPKRAVLEWQLFRTASHEASCWHLITRA